MPSIWKQIFFSIPPRCVTRGGAAALPTASLCLICSSHHLIPTEALGRVELCIGAAQQLPFIGAIAIVSNANTDCYTQIERDLIPIIVLDGAAQALA